MALRIVSTQPGNVGRYRLDQRVAAIARRSMSLMDPCFLVTSSYVLALGRQRTTAQICGCFSQDKRYSHRAFHVARRPPNSVGGWSRSLRMERIDASRHDCGGRWLRGSSGMYQPEYQALD